MVIFGSKSLITHQNTKCAWFCKGVFSYHAFAFLDQAIENIGDAGESAREKIGEALEGSGKTDESNDEDLRD